MHFSVLTIFPEMLDSLWKFGIIRRAIEQVKIRTECINIRDFAEGKHQCTDDRPYGGGCGMVMKPEPLSKAILDAKKRNPSSKAILLSPQGRVFNQKIAQELSVYEGLILVCGRYEGIDERVYQTYIDDELSIGDYILTGGELAAMVVIDAVARLIPGILGGVDSAEKDSFESELLEHAHYTRPRSFNEQDVPEVLLSGNHKEIERYRLETSLIRTFLKRPDLLQKRKFSKQEKVLLEKWCKEIEHIIRT